MANEWKVARQGACCAACGHAFQVGETFLAVLYASQDDTYERRDFCAECEPVSDPPPVGQWKAHRSAPVEAKSKPFDRETTFELFLRMEDASSPEKLQFRFVLALLLWRKKGLKFVESGADDAGRETWRFTKPGGPECYEVVKPDLDEDQIETLSAQLEALLMSGTSPEDETVAAEAGDADG